MAEAALEALLEEARAAPIVLDSPTVDNEVAIPTFGDAVDTWLKYLEVEKLRKKGTVQDAQNVAQSTLLPRFGVDTPLFDIERQEVVVRRDGRQHVEVRRSVMIGSRPVNEVIEPAIIERVYGVAVRRVDDEETVQLIFGPPAAAGAQFNASRK